MAWFQEEVVEKTKPPQVGDSVHVMGYLIYNDTIRKIQVLDFSKFVFDFDVYNLLYSKI